MFGIIFFHITAIFVFRVKDLSSLKKKINKNKYRMNKNKMINKSKKGKNNNKNKLNQISIYGKDKKRKINKQTNKKINIKNVIIINNNKSKILTKINKNSQHKDEKVKNISEFIDEEINELSYNLAIQYDKRNCIIILK